MIPTPLGRYPRTACSLTHYTRHTHELLGWSYLSYYSYSCRSLGRDRGCTERVTTAAAAAATATVSQQMTRVPGTGWVSGAQRADSAPDCTFGPALQWLSHACLDAPCHVTHTHTHTHTNTPCPHVDPDITHTHTHTRNHTRATRRPRYHTHTCWRPCGRMGPRYVMCG